MNFASSVSQVGKVLFNVNVSNGNQFAKTNVPKIMSSNDTQNIEPDGEHYNILILRIVIFKQIAKHL